MSTSHGMKAFDRGPGARRRMVAGARLSAGRRIVVATDTALNDLKSARTAIGAWINASGPLREQVAAAMAELRAILGATAPTVSSIVDALDGLVAAAAATDAWLDAAGPLRSAFMAAVSAWRTLVGANDGTDAALDNAGIQIDAWLDAAGPLRQQLDDALAAACTLLAADVQGAESGERSSDLEAIVAGLRDFGWIARQ